VNPRFFGDLAAGSVEAIALRGDLAGRQYALTAGASGFAVVDVFTQGRSLQVASAKTSGSALAVALGSLEGPGDVAVVADGSEGVKVFAAGNAPALGDSSLLGSLDTENAVDVKLYADPAGARIFVADRSRGLRVIGVEGEGQRLRLRHLIGLETGGDARAVDVQRRDGRLLAYAADAQRGLTIFDVSDVGSARQLASLSLEGARDVAVRGTLAYVAMGMAGLEIVDVTDPAAPRPRSRLGSLHARTVAVAELASGTILAAVTGSEGLTLADLSDADAPRVVSVYRSRYAEDAVVAEGRVYLAEGIGGLSVLDVRRPEVPRKVSSSDVEYAIAVGVRGEYAFVVDHQGLRVVRILVPDWLVGR